MCWSRVLKFDVLAQGSYRKFWSDQIEDILVAFCSVDFRVVSVKVFHFWGHWHFSRTLLESFKLYNKGMRLSFSGHWEATAISKVPYGWLLLRNLEYLFLIAVLFRSKEMLRFSSATLLLCWSLSLFPTPSL